MSNSRLEGRTGLVITCTLVATVFAALAAAPRLACAQAFGWSLRDAPGPSARWGHVMAYDAARQRVMMFGGQGGTNLSNAEMWQLNPDGWALRSTGGPSPRTQPAMAFDAARSECVLFGGRNGATGAINGETWVWNGTGWAQRAVGMTAPPPRRSAAMAYDAVRQRVVMFGGYNDETNTHLGDTWEWDGVAWSPVVGSGPSPRNGHGLVYDPSRHTVVMFGGFIGSALNREVWEFNGSAWSLRSSVGSEPSARQSMAMAFDDSRNVMVIFGGDTGSGQASADTWNWNGTSSSWTNAQLAGPTARYSPAMVYDASRGIMVMFGGISGSTSAFADTWELGIVPPIWTASYDPSLGTLPQLQGWTYDGSSPSPSPSNVNNGALSYGPTTDVGDVLWRIRPPVIDFSATTWSCSATVRLTGTTFGEVAGLRRGGFEMYLQDDAGRWIVACTGSNGLSLRNENAGASVPAIVQDLATDFRTVRLEAGPGGARLYLDDVLMQTLPIGSGGPNGGGAYWGEASSLARTVLTEVRSVSLTSSVPFSSAGLTDNAVFSGTRPDPGESGPPTTLTFNSLTIQPGGVFTLGSNETLNLNNGTGTLYIQPGAVFYGNGVIIGNVVNASLMIIPITRAGLIGSITSPPGGPNGLLMITPPEPRPPTPQPPIVLPFPPPPTINPGVFVTLGASGFGGTNGGNGGGGGYWPGWYELDCLPNSGTLAWDGRLDVTGFFNQTATGVLRMFIAGDIQGETYSYLHVGTTASLEGELQVVLQPELFDYLPRTGDTFDLITAVDGITLPSGSLNIRTLMTAQGAAWLGISLPAFDSGFTPDPNQLVALPANLFSYALVNGGTTLRITMTQPVMCADPAAVISRLTCPTGGADFSVSGIGASPLTFRWQYRGAAGFSPTDWTDLADGSTEFGSGIAFFATGAGTPSLSIVRESGVWPVLGVGMGGSFRCVLANTCGAMPSQAAALSVCKADINCSSQITVQDVFDFLAGYFAGAPSGDFNSSGAPTVQDIFDFLAAYFAGCA